MATGKSSGSSNQSSKGSFNNLNLLSGQNTSQTVGGTSGSTVTGGTSTGTQTSPWGAFAGQVANQINIETDPVRSMFLSQMQQILSGNEFTSSTIPLIQQGVANQMQAGKTAFADTQANFARAGADSSTYAAAGLSNVEQGTAQAVGAVPSQVSQAYLNQIPGTIAGNEGAVSSGFGTAASTNFNTAGTSSSFENSLSNFIQNFGSQFSQAGFGRGSTFSSNAGSEASTTSDIGALLSSLIGAGGDIGSSWLIK